MDAIGSVVTIVLVLAAFVVPQALVLYFSGWRKRERDEFIPDGR